MHGLKIPRVGLWAAFYSGLGGLILLLSEGLWTEGMQELGIPTSAEISLTDAMLFGVLCLVVLTLGLSILTGILTLKKKGPFSIAAAYVFVTLVTYYVIGVASYLVRNPITVAAFSAFWSLIFGFIAGGLIGCSIYLHLTLAEKKSRELRNYELGLEVLKMEHSWFLTAFTSLSYASLIFVVSAVLVSWTQMVLPSLPSPIHYGVSIFKLFLTTSIQLIYAGVGLWFGLVGKLLGYSLWIHQRVLELEKLKLAKSTKSSGRHPD